jgi:hypothetical protein
MSGYSAERDSSRSTPMSIVVLAEGGGQVDEGGAGSGAVTGSRPSDLNLAQRRGVHAASDLEHDLGFRLPRPGLALPWGLVGWDHSCLLSRGLAGVRASLAATQLPGHERSFRSDPQHSDLPDDVLDVLVEGRLVLPFVDGPPPEGLPQDARHALIALGYATHLFQSAEYLECSLLLAGHGHLPAAVMCARSALETAWRMDASLGWISAGPSGLEQDLDIVAFALQGEDRHGRDGSIGRGIADALVAHWARMQAAVEHEGSRPPGDEGLQAIIGDPKSLYSRLSEYVHLSARAAELHWGWELVPSGAVRLPLADRSAQARIRRTLVEACTAVTLLLDSGRTRWLALHQEVDGFMLRRSRARILDQTTAFPDRRPADAVMTLRTATQQWTDDLVGERWLDGLVEQAEAFAIRATTRRQKAVVALSSELVGRALALRHLQLAVQELAARHRLAAAGTVARAMLERAHALARILHDSADLSVPDLVRRLRTGDEHRPTDFAWLEAALRHPLAGLARTAVAEDQDLAGHLRQSLNDLVHPNQLARLLTWAEYFGTDGEGEEFQMVLLRSVPKGGITSGAGPGRDIGDGFHRACDVLASALVASDHALLLALSALYRATEAERRRQ